MTLPPTTPSRDDMTGTVKPPVAAVDGAAGPSWQGAWGRSLRTTRDLLSYLELDPAGAPVDPDPTFPIRVPHAYADLMRKGDWNDPLLRQVLALRTERGWGRWRSEEHTSELQSRENLVCRLLLDKKNMATRH